MTDTPASGNYIELTAEIVSAYVSNNTVPASEIPSLINQVHAALARVSGKSGDATSESSPITFFFKDLFDMGMVGLSDCIVH